MLVSVISFTNSYVKYSPRHSMRGSYLNTILDFKPWEVTNGRIIYKEVMGERFERLRIWVSEFKTHEQDGKL